MAIKLLNDGIKIGNFTLKETTNGFSFDGKAAVAGTSRHTSPNGFGNTRGYTSGGYFYLQSPLTQTTFNTIDSFLFSSYVNSSDIGDLSAQKADTAGNSSKTHGYVSGGNPPPQGIGNPVNVIERFTFGALGNATDVGDLSTTTDWASGQSSDVFGYISAGRNASLIAFNTINKFPFASTGIVSTSVGNLTENKYATAGISSATHGYVTAGNAPSLAPDNTNTIDKFPFATDASSTNIGSLTTRRSRSTGHASISEGFTAGSYVPTPAGPPRVSQVIDKFPFATDTSAISHSNLVGHGPYTDFSGTSSASSGFVAGGRTDGFSGFIYTNSISSFSFNTSQGTFDVADLSVTRSDSSGQQV